ncbi:MAG: Biopolymer transport protein ExbD/TolR [Nitrospira sp.]|jgi:biopolymer transport protein ExbD|nr:MAG: Biopolymer transport protein ExbD/TolR [Nitrospira sp.]
MERELQDINVIPLVDVMLVLLVIVLTTATFITTGQVPVELAKAKEAGDRKDVPLVITLTSEGQLFMNDRPVPPDGLKVVLTPHPRESSVLVRADRVTVLERFVSVVDEVRGLGFKQVNLEVVRS